jgi:hypothetical protein
VEGLDASFNESSSPPTKEEPRRFVPLSNPAKKFRTCNTESQKICETAASGLAREDYSLATSQKHVSFSFWELLKDGRLLGKGN